MFYGKFQLKSMDLVITVRLNIIMLRDEILQFRLHFQTSLFLTGM